MDNQSPKTPILDCLENPQDLQNLNPTKLQALCEELRLYLIWLTAQTGGHLSSNLGVIELTVALFHCLNMAEDTIVWDVGHQAYIHKILTHRRAKMLTIRQKDGLSGFTKRTESDYDWFGAGHASTSISACLGISEAKRQKGERSLTVAVIGDGSMTGGLAYEALNNAIHHPQNNLLIILNDNEMSISANVGGITKALNNIITSRGYQFLKGVSKEVLTKTPTILELAKRSEEHLKGMFLPSTLFEELGVNYYGPVDGHNLEALTKALRDIYPLQGVRLLHIATQKGFGLKEAEKDPLKYHGIKATPTSTKEDGLDDKNQSPPIKTISLSEIFGQWLCRVASQDSHMIAITPAMAVGSGMQAFAKQYPNQFFDVGIAEAHSLTFAAGFCAHKKHTDQKAVVAIYATFLQRAYDQLIHDICIQNLPVLLAIDRAGIVGEDGPTHSGQFDCAFLNPIPNLTIVCPSGGGELYQLLESCYHHRGPTAIRYPKASVDLEGFKADLMVNEGKPHLRIGEAKVVRQVVKSAGMNAPKIAILNFGWLLTPCLQAGEKLNACVVDMRFVKPLDKGLLAQMVKDYNYLVSVEEGAIIGGAGSLVLTHLMQQYPKWFRKGKFLQLGLADTFVEQGSRNQMLAYHQLDADGIEKQIKDFLKKAH